MYGKHKAYYQSCLKYIAENKLKNVKLNIIAMM